MRDKRAERRRRRQKQAMQDAAAAAMAAAGYFERVELDELTAAARRAEHTAIAFNQKYSRMIERAGKCGQAAAERQKDARQAHNNHRLAIRRGADEGRAAAASAADAWKAASAAAQSEADAWKAASAAAWKIVAAITECIHISEVATKRTIEHADAAEGKDRRAAAVRIKATRDWEKQVKEWAKEYIERVNTIIAKTGQYGAASQAWAAGADGMAKAWAGDHGAGVGRHGPSG